MQDLASIRLVQRQCVAVKNAEWIGSDVTNNLDQAHKMLGMHADGALNVITVPVHYTKRVNSNDDWWWYQWQTAVGLMTWDLDRYDRRAPGHPAERDRQLRHLRAPARRGEALGRLHPPGRRRPRG